jgi:S-adenosylmethionine-diacylglycerol 3-amino-3-carboxypropyl transferase
MSQTKKNRLQFAVVREDPALEERLLRDFCPRSVLLIASGGCTAFHLASHFPNLPLTLLDPNPAQLEAIQKKIHYFKGISQGLQKTFDLESFMAETQKGNFESLFRNLRLFLEEMVAPLEAWEAFFERGSEKNASTSPFLTEVFAHPYWPVAFQLFFSDSLLKTMFGPAAIQNALSGSYPSYFQKAFERGLQRNDPPHNYFLHHVFLGRYQRNALPDYLRNPPSTFPFEWVLGDLSAIPSFSAFELLQFSNIFDWMSSLEIESLFKRIREETKKETIVVWRQLNNPQNLKAKLAPLFTFDTERERFELQADRSFFYSQICIGKKT